MTGNGWTSGPWRVGHSGFERKPCVVGRGLTGAPFTVAHVSEEGDAHLIAAAPDLFAALEGLIDGFPFPATVNEYELIQSGCDPTEAAKIAAAMNGNKW